MDFQAEGQWRPLLDCLVSEVRHALLASVIQLPSSISAGSNGLLPAQHTLPTTLRAKATAEVTGSSNDSAEECSPEKNGKSVEEGVSGTADSISTVAPVLWQPGLEAVILDGGHDVQGVLDSEGVALGVVHWHASWIAECNDLQPLLQR